MNWFKEYWIFPFTLYVICWGVYMVWITRSPQHKPKKKYKEFHEFTNAERHANASAHYMEGGNKNNPWER